jgi:hypothetical protein
LSSKSQNRSGIWTGQKGLSKGSDQNQAARDRVLESLQKQLAYLIMLLRETENAIDQCGEVLSISQPARISGKYGLRWWRIGPGLPYHEPVIVRWMMQKNGKMTPKRAKVLKARKNGAMSINAAETQECLEILSGLINKRSEIKGRIFSITKSVRGLDGIFYRINNESERIQGLRSRAIENLISAGYEIEPRFLCENNNCEET